jgi:hypothetical protein
VACDFIPGNEAKMPDLRVTSDKFCMAIERDGTNAAAITSLLNKLGAEEVHEKELEL